MMNTATVVLDLKYVSNDAIAETAESDHHLEFHLHRLVNSKFPVNSNIVGFLRGAPGLRFGAADKERVESPRSKPLPRTATILDQAHCGASYALSGECQPYRDSAAHQFATRVGG